MFRQIKYLKLIRIMYKTTTNYNFQKIPFTLRAPATRHQRMISESTKTNLATLSEVKSAWNTCSSTKFTCWSQVPLAGFSWLVKLNAEIALKRQKGDGD